MSIVKNILISLAIGFIFAILENIFCTQVLTTFLKNNLITILIALLAINSATLSIVLTKIREIMEQHRDKADFTLTRKEMLFSIYEQVVLIFIFAVVLIICSSKIFDDFSISVQLFLNSMLIGNFIYGVLILLDTAKSIFVILDFKKEF